MASFFKYIPLLNQVEGGFQADPDDNGNYNSLDELAGTNHGVSARFYEQILGYPPSRQDMVELSKQEAEQIFRQYFWTANKASQIDNQYVANTIIDHQVNAGKGVRLAQRVLNAYFGYNLVVDGIMGKKTLSALNSVNAENFVAHYNASRKAYYEEIGGKFLNGWLSRLSKFAYKNSAAISFGLVSVISVSVLLYKLILKK